MDRQFRAERGQFLAVEGLSPLLQRAERGFASQVRENDIIGAWSAINKAVKTAYIDGKMPIVMNGDHSQAVGSVSAAK